MKTLNEVLQDWEAVIGLEIHTELTTLNSKMFCSCKLSSDDEPNANTCPVCLGHPGALPVPNKAAIESIVLAGLATKCDIEKHSMFYRKNYFYPDMAKNFQTTQGPVAFAMRGEVDLEIDAKDAKERTYDIEHNDVELNEDGGYTAKIGITRIHMEEDAGKLVHVGGVDGRISGANHSFIDYNRAGTPLIELVSEPDIRTPEEARHFMETIRQIFLTIGISDCSMERGSMRCDGNVSLRPRGQAELGIRTELKNLNSFKSLHDGLEYEIRRQCEVLEEGGTVKQETRHWEASNRRTIILRTKEMADDYRLFPEPDLAPYDLSDEFIEGVASRLPELPEQRRDRYREDFGLKKAEAAALSGDVATAEFFEAAVVGNTKVAKQISNLIQNDLAGYLNAESLSIGDIDITPQHMGSLAVLIADGSISSKQGKEVFACMIETGNDPAAIASEKGMKQVSDTDALGAIVDEVLANCTDQVNQYKEGNQKVIGFLVGQCMKASKGQGNPKLLNGMLREKLDAL